MNSKMILLTGLLFTVVMSMVVTGFTYYALSGVTTSQTGDALVKSKVMYFYIQLATHILLLGFTAGVFYKR